MRVGEQKGPEIASQRDDFLGREGQVYAAGWVPDVTFGFPSPFRLTKRKAQRFAPVLHAENSMPREIPRLHVFPQR